MTYDEKHDELQRCFLEKFKLFHQLTDNATGEEKQSAACLKIKEEFEEINVDYQNFLMLVKAPGAADFYQACTRECNAEVLVTRCCLLTIRRA